MKNIIKIEVDKDNNTYITLNGETIEDKEGWDYSFCETPADVAEAMEMIFQKIQGEDFDFVKVEVEEFSE
jgi:hypothetical protein